MKIAICDDNDIELKKVKKSVEHFISSKQADHIITLQTFTNGTELLAYIDKNGNFDLMILDIIMPGMNGIELATEIRIKDSSCKIIFLTSSPEFAVNSYRVNALYYLLKPFSNVELESMLNKSLNEIQEEKSQNIVVKEKGKLTRIQIHTIKYIESVKHTIIFHFRNREAISCYGTMKEFEFILLSDRRFIKCHKSFVVNMNSVVSISGKDFLLDDKTLIPISRNVYPQVKNNYINYFFEKGNGLEL